MDVGDRVTIDNQPAWLPPDQISQLAYGFAERLDTHSWATTVNSQPETPYKVGIYGTTKYDTGGSQLAATAAGVGLWQFSLPVTAAESFAAPVSLRDNGAPVNQGAVADGRAGSTGASRPW